MTNTAIVTIGCILGVLIVISINRLIFCKKTVYYKWIDKTKRLTVFDYVQNYGSMWLLKPIDYKLLLSSNPSDTNLKLLVKEIRLLEITSIVLVVMFLMFAIVLKFLGY
jgi:hypothetical protein